MALTQTPFFDATFGDVNVPGAVCLYQSFLIAGTVVPPLGVQQIGPFAFDFEGDDSVDQENEVTDHYLEDNTAVQDHIGVKPIIVTLKGSVSELSFSAATSGLITAALSSVENTLSQADAYLGAYTPGVTQTLLTAITQAQNVATQIEQAAARVAQIASFFTPGIQYTKQQQAFAQLSALRLARTVFTVYTPFQVFFNMVIQSLSATQPAHTKTQADFVVTMKQLQFTDDISQSSFLTQYGGRAANGFQPQTSNGLTSGVTATLSAIQAVF
jgi:hypothetical protein